jgi:predicted SprT family Zn-dependent metalloprotease
MWTIEIIKNLCIEYCGRADVEFDAPVKINNRLTRTLGRCKYINENNKWKPVQIEISGHLLKTATDSSIEAVIAHECAHYVTCALTHTKHGHDSTFRFYCEKIGTNNSMTCYDDLKRTKSNEEIYKYTIYCSKCGKFIGGRSRACNVTKNPQNYFSNCCDADIKIIQNW